MHPAAAGCGSIGQKTVEADQGMDSLDAQHDMMSFGLASGGQPSAAH